MLDKGVIRYSNSSWSAPAILVPKKRPRRKTSVQVLFRYPGSELRHEGRSLPLALTRGSYIHPVRIKVILSLRLLQWILANGYKVGA